MKMTLRKAHRLVKELESHLRIRDARKNVHHSASEEEVKATIAAVELASKESVLQAIEVVSAITEIRSALQAANSRDIDGETVDTLLNRKVQIEKTMRLLSQFAKASDEEADERETRILREVRDSHESTSEYRSTQILVAGHNPAVHNEFNEKYVALKQEQEVVSDKLAYINNKLEIEVDDKFKDLFKVLQVL